MSSQDELFENEINELLSNIKGNEERLIELLVIKKDFDKIADLASDIKSSSDLLEAIFMNEDSGDDAWAAITINPNRIIPDDIDFFNDLNDDAKIIQLNNPTFPLNLLEHIVENINDYENAEELLKLVAQHPNTNDDLMIKLHETQFAEIDYKNIIDDIIKNEDEDKLNTLVNKTDLDPNLLDCILLNGDEISDFCELDISIVGHKDFNLSNKIPIIDDDGYLFICDVDDNKLVLLNPDFNIDFFYDCVKNKTCTKDILTELVKKILEKVEDLKIKDELLKLVTQHPNADDEMDLTINVLNLCNSIEPEIDINYDEFNVAYQNISNFKNKTDGTYWWELVTEINNSINSSQSVVGKTPENCSFNSFFIDNYDSTDESNLIIEKLKDFGLLTINFDGKGDIDISDDWDAEHVDFDSEEENEIDIVIDEFITGDYLKSKIKHLGSPFYLSFHAYSGEFKTVCFLFNGKKLFKYEGDNYDWFSTFKLLEIYKNIITDQLLYEEDSKYDLDSGTEPDDDYLQHEEGFELNYRTHYHIGENWKFLGET